MNCRCALSQVWWLRPGTQTSLRAWISCFFAMDGLRAPDCARPCRIRKLHPGAAIVAEERNEPGPASFDARHAVQRAPAAEDHQCSDVHRLYPHAVRLASHDVADSGEILVGFSANVRRELEGATALGRLQQQRDDEVIAVEMPTVLVAVAHGRDGT